MLKFDESLAFLQGFLNEADYIAGESLTIADFATIATLSTAEATGHDLNKFPIVKAYMEKCKNEIVGYNENETGAKQFGDFIKSQLAS